jgi:hypothetical protein
MTQEGWIILALIGLPVLAVISIGVLARAFVDGRRQPLGVVGVGPGAYVWGVVLRLYY